MKYLDMGYWRATIKQHYAHYVHTVQIVAWALCINIRVPENCASCAASLGYGLSNANVRGEKALLQLL